MNINITVLIAVLGLILSVITFFVGQKKASADDGQEYGEFMGEIRADIRNIKDDIKEIKNDRERLKNEIDHAISEHVKAYHGKP